MSKRLKRGDEVVVIAGSHKGGRGKIMDVITGKNRVVIEGVNMIKRNMRKSEQYPEGAVIEREGSIHYSNVMLAERHEQRGNKS